MSPRDEVPAALGDAAVSGPIGVPAQSQYHDWRSAWRGSDQEAWSQALAALIEEQAPSRRLDEHLPEVENLNALGALALFGFVKYPGRNGVWVKLFRDGQRVKAVCECKQPGLCASAWATVLELYCQLNGVDRTAGAQIPPRAPGARELPTPAELEAQRRKRELGDLNRLLEQAAQWGAGEANARKNGALVRIVWRVALGQGHPAVEAYEQKQRANGGWTGGRKISYDQLEYLSGSSQAPAELQAVGRLVVVNGGYYSRSCSLDGRLALEALEGSRHVTLAADPTQSVTIRRGEVVLELRPQREGLRLIPVLTSGSVRLEVVGPLEPSLGVAVAWELPSALVLVARVPERARALVEHLTRSALTVPWAEGPALLVRLAQLEEVLPLSLPQLAEGAGAGPDGAGAALRAVPADERMRLVLEPRGVDGPVAALSVAEAGPELLARVGLRAALRVRPVERAPLQLPGDGRAELPSVDGEGLVLVRRDLLGERDRARAAAEALALGEARATWSWELDLERSLALLERLEDAPPPGVLVEWAGEERLRVSRPVDEKSFRVVVRDMREWFQLDGSLEVDGERVELALLLASLRQGGKYVPLPGGRFLRLSARLRARLEALRDVARARTRRGEQELELDATAAPAVAEALEGVKGAELATGWRDVMRRLEAAQDVSVRVPRRLKATLRDYQREGWAWLKRLSTFGAGACLADDMGLGKTVQTIAVLLDRAALGPALVVAPTSVVPNWARELGRFAPSLQVTELRRSGRDEETVRGLGPGHVLLASYDLARLDAGALGSREWATLVLDEAQRVKNAHTRTASALAGLRVQWRLALTGTPLENRLSDLWGLFRIVSPGLLGSWDSFRERFAVPIERDKDPLAAAALARLIRPYVLRRTKEQVLTELPPRSEQRVEVRLTRGERTLYDDARIEALASLEQLMSEATGQEARIHALAALTRLRQLACHPALVEGSWRGRSSKLAALLELVRELIESGHRALVFSQFTAHLALVRQALDAEQIGYGYLDGSTPARERQAAIDAFQGGQDPLFLISLKAGGVGLNLTAADYVIHLDPWWNPAVEDQATGRAHRIGQKRPVTVYRLVTRDTVEEQILALHEQKRGLVSAVLEGSDRAGALSTEELVDLIRGGAQGAEVEVGEDPEPAEPEAQLPQPPQPKAQPPQPAAQPKAQPPQPLPQLGARIIPFPALPAPAPAAPTRRPPAPTAPAGQASWTEGLWDGEELIMRRLREGYTQRDLAEHLGVSPATVSRWERNLSAPWPEQLDELLDLLGE